MFEGLRIPGQAYPGSFSYAIPAASVKSVLERNSSLYKPWSPFLSAQQGSMGSEPMTTLGAIPTPVGPTPVRSGSPMLMVRITVSPQSPDRRLCLIELEDVPDLDEAPEPISEKKSDRIWVIYGPAVLTRVSARSPSGIITFCRAWFYFSKHTFWRIYVTIRGLSSAVESRPNRVSTRPG